MTCLILNKLIVSRFGSYSGDLSALRYISDRMHGSVEGYKTHPQMPIALTAFSHLINKHIEYPQRPFPAVITAHAVSRSARFEWIDLPHHRRMRPSASRKQLCLSRSHATMTLMPWLQEPRCQATDDKMAHSLSAWPSRSVRFGLSGPLTLSLRNFL